MKLLNIETKRCRGIDVCNSCESVCPGIFHACDSSGGSVNIQEWALHEGEVCCLIEELICSCPDKAIHII